MAQKEPEFTVSDKRKFTLEGEMRDDAKSQPTEPEPPAKEPASVATMPAPPTEAPQPTAEEHREQHAAYQDSSRKLDDMLSAAGHAKPEGFEINFQRIVESYYMTALMQLGAIRMDGEEPRIDIIGARQTIDTLGVLSEKTKGNLTPAEQTLLQNATFELRMLFLELSNAIARSAVPGAPQSGGFKK